MKIHLPFFWIQSLICEKSAFSKTNKIRNAFTLGLFKVELLILLIPAIFDSIQLSKIIPRFNKQALFMKKSLIPLFSEFRRVTESRIGEGGLCPVELVYFYEKSNFCAWLRYKFVESPMPHFYYMHPDNYRDKLDRCFQQKTHQEQLLQNE